MIHQFKSRGRLVLQKLCVPQIAIIGGYHGGNLGDMALGRAVAEEAEKMGFSVGLQTIYDLQKWPVSAKAIVGGGAVIHEETFKRLLDRYGRDPRSLAITGVDVEDFSVVIRHAVFLRELAYFSVRSKAQADRVNEILGCDKAQYHPDIVFSLMPHDRSRYSNLMPMTSFINITPRFHLNSDLLCEDNVLSQPVSYRRLADGYEYMLRRYMSQMRDCGFSFHHLSFTPEDQNIGKKIVNVRMVVNWERYSDDVFRVLKRFSSFEYGLPCRYHSLIFSIINQMQVLPLAYADKSIRLLQELDVEERRYITLNDLLDKKKIDAKLEIINSKEVLVRDSALEKTVESARTAIRDAIKSLA